MVYILIILSIFISDNLIKKYIEENKEFHKEEEILKGQIILTKYHNRGAMLNFLEKKPYAVKVISAMMLVLIGGILCFLIPKKGDKLLKLSLSLVLGGGCSNIYDRLTKGYVVDYFSFKRLKKVVFNNSDMCIIIGSFLASIAILIKKK